MPRRQLFFSWAISFYQGLEIYATEDTVHSVLVHATFGRQFVARSVYKPYSISHQNIQYFLPDFNLRAKIVTPLKAKNSKRQTSKQNMSSINRL